MEKHRITALLVAISLALSGLIGIQVKWMRDSLALREAQFDRSVDHALFTVSDRLEQMEKMRDLRRHKAGRRLLRKLDAMRRTRDEKVGMRDDAMPVAAEVEPIADGTLQPDTQEHWMKEDTGWHAEEEAHEALITDMVRGILADELARDIRERIEAPTLDSLLNVELRSNGVQGAFSYGIFTAEGDQVELGQDRRLDATTGGGNVYRERLFRHDLAGPVYYLHVQVPGHRGLLWRDMLPLLLTSALFMAIIVVAFFFTIRTIFRQKRIGEIRNDLVNNLTHELKTPISTIGLACEALADPSMPKTEQQVRTFTAMIRDENKRLGSLVENVLQSAVLESGHMVLKRVDLDVHALIQDVVRSSGMQVSRRNGLIHLDLKAEIHHVSGDRIHLTNLLYNLIDNAVKYTEQEPRIRIATVSNDEGITVSVTDNGIGISPSEQRKIFDRLYRVPTGNIHNAKGFGLGLSYVRTVVERHGGRIRLESAPGRGSTFHIFIPFEHVSIPQAVSGRG
ncbi:MAG: HAMP domain-containing histidine kinase [Flavobacteriales bacterium]|nr:HAMP domain-containing histidine kinase [Flavobacteriales bacterium]